MSAIISKRHYTHPRFMDVSFVAIKSFMLPNRFKVKCEWFARGRSTGVTTKHEIPRVNEFYEVGR